MTDADHPAYLRNFISKKQAQFGVPLRNAQANAEQDYLIRGYQGGVISFQPGDFFVAWPMKTPDAYDPAKYATFPLRLNGPIVHRLAPRVADVCIGDTLQYIDETSYVKNFHQLPGQSWVRLTLAVRGTMETVTVLLKTSRVLSRAEIRQGIYNSSHLLHIPVEYAGPYKCMKTGLVKYFAVHQSGRGPYPNKMPAHNAHPHIYCKPPLGKAWRDYHYLGEYVTGRHPGDAIDPQLKSVYFEN